MYDKNKIKKMVQERAEKMEFHYARPSTGEIVDMVFEIIEKEGFCENYRKGRNRYCSRGRS